MKAINKLERLLKKANELDKNMHDTLVRAIKDSGKKVIITDPHIEENKRCDKIYCNVWDDERDESVECEVLAVTVLEGDKLAIIPNIDGVSTLEELSEECVFENGDWYIVFGGYVQSSSILYELCQCIGEYME